MHGLAHLPVGTDCWLSLVHPTQRVGVVFNVKKASDCFLVPDHDPEADDFAKADCMS